MVLYFSFFPSLFCGAEFTARTPVPGAPWAAGGGEGGGSREMNGERGFCTVELHRIGEVFIRVRHCPYRISHSVRSAFYGVSGKAARPSISTEAWPTGQRGMTPQQCQQQHPLRSGSEESWLRIHPRRFPVPSGSPHLPAALSKEPRSMECSLHAIWQPLMEQLMGKLLKNHVWCHEPLQQTVVQEKAPA